MKGFGSDNHSGVHPQLLESIIACNVDHQPSYGTDSFSHEAIELFKKHFGLHSEVFFVFNGTASNALALRFLAQRHESILCSQSSHLNLDECGAPEFFAGKLISIEDKQGKMSLADLKEAVIRRGDQHYSQTRVVSLTQPTELGTCYSIKEIKEITEWAHANSMFVHIDGARLTNALIFLKCTYKELTTDLGVDVVSFGGTKNGLLMGEAIVVLNPELAKKSVQGLKYIRKQSAQLPSKTRFIAAQFACYLKDELYLDIAHHATKMAERLYQGLKTNSAITITCERQSNAVFAIIPQAWVKTLRETFFFYVWDEKTFECRLMTSWDTKESEIDAFVELAQSLNHNN
jgi:threonine aldolase